jgi:hypothetical protein
VTESGSETAPAKKGRPDLVPRPRPSHVAGQVLATLTASFALSFLGTAGTITGLALGAALSAVLPTAYENAMELSRHKAKLALERKRQAGSSTGFAADYEYLFRSSETARKPACRMPWKRVGLAAALLFVCSAAAITAAEALAGKPVSAVVTGTHGSGYTFGGGYTAPAPASPPPTRSATPPVTVTPSVSPPVSPTSATPAATPSAATTAPSVTTPSSSPTGATPDDSAAT